METAKKNQIEQEVIAWLRKELCLSEKAAITASTRVNYDLGVAGDDGSDLIEAFGKQFGVDTSEVPLAQYFGDETALNPFWIFVYLVRKIGGKSMHSLQPLYVADLVALVTNM